MYLSENRKVNRHSQVRPTNELRTLRAAATAHTDVYLAYGLPAMLVE